MIKEIKQFCEPGLFLVPIPPVNGKPTKGPQGEKATGWNKPRSANNPNGYSSKADDFLNCNGFNFGLAHVPSRTMALDLDALDKCLTLFDDVGLPLQAWLNDLNRVEIQSGKPNRGKLLFRLPDGVESFATQQLKIKCNDDPKKTKTIFEIRNASKDGVTVQDVIFGTHPETGTTYKVIGDIDNIPEIPEELLSVALHWDDWKPCFDSALGIEQEPHRSAPQQPQQGENLPGMRDPITEFNQSGSVAGVLIRNSYKQAGKDRFIRPGSESKAPGAVIMRNCTDGIERVYSHGGDVLNDGFAHDGFDCLCLLEYGGDFTKALNWNPEITKHNQRVFMQEQAKNRAEPPWDESNTGNEDMDMDSTNLAHDYPAFNDSGFYGIAGEVAVLATEQSEADPVAVYFSFLTAAAAMVGRYKYLQVGDSRHYARLFTAVVGASSRARKGTSFKPVERTIRKAEEMYQKTANDSLIETLVIANGGLSSAEGLIFAVRDESEETKGKENTPVWLGIDDKRLLVVEEELGGVLKVAQREGNQLSPVLRKAWDGGTLAPMTKNNRMCSTDPHINAIGHITQFELKELLSNSDIYNGLVNRFLWVCVRRTKKLSHPQPMDSSKVMSLAIRFASAFKKSKDAENNEIELDAKARELWDAQYHIISTDRHGVIGAVTARNEAHVLRLALLFCLLDGVSAITTAHLNAAIHAVNYSTASCEFIFTVPSEESPDAQKLLSALDVKPMSQTEINRLFNSHKTRSQMTELLTDLQTLNKIRKQKTPGSKTIIWEKI